MTRPWSNLAKVVYARTYARSDAGKLENFANTVERVIAGNLRIVSEKGLMTPREIEAEANQLRYFMNERKAGPAGRGFWFSGAPAHARIGGAALNNCWGLTANHWEVFADAMDLLMLGGGVGLSVEHKYVSKLPEVKPNVAIVSKDTKDADFIVPDSREGWCELFRRMLEAYFVTGKGFTYSTVCIRGFGEKIVGFGGTASGPIPLRIFVEDVVAILSSRGGKHLRPIDAMDLICCTGQMVVAGNVRRSAILILGDYFDEEYLTAKRWDLGNVPNYRAFANLSVVCSNTENLPPLFWKTYENGEPFGIVNVKNMKAFGRMGERKKDACVVVNPCAEATLEPYEPCNLQEISLPALQDAEEFEAVARLMHRYGKRVTLESYHIPAVQKVIDRNRRVGTGITGCLESPLFAPDALDRAYAAIQLENTSYSAKLGIPESIRTTVVKPSGTMSKMMDCSGEGIHPAFSKHMIQRIRFAANDPLIPLLRAAGHHMEPSIKFDGSIDPGTLVVDFYLEAPAGVPVADDGWDTWKQLDVLKLAQKHWADQAVSVTVYYRREELSAIKDWLRDNLQYLKTISFLCHNDHGFKQAPKEAITQAQYEELSKKISPIEAGDFGTGDLATALECEGGVCPVK